MEIEREGLGSKIQVALRKTCSSPQTSAMWNFVKLVAKYEPETWTKIVDHIYGGLRSYACSKPTQQDYAVALKKTLLRDPDSGEGGLDFIGSYGLSGFYSLCEMFSEKDWFDICSYLIEE